jgi:hypothetical protein
MIVELLLVLLLLFFISMSFIFLHKNTANESLVNTVFANKVSFFIILMFMIVFFFPALLIGREMTDKVFTVLQIFMILVFSTIIIFMFGIIVLIKVTSTNRLEIYEAPANPNNPNMPTYVAFEKKITENADGGIVGVLLENVSFYPGTNKVSSYKKPLAEDTRTVFISADKVHYKDDRTGFYRLKTYFTDSKDPRYDIEVSNRTLNDTEDVLGLIDKLENMRRRSEISDQNYNSLLVALQTTGSQGETIAISSTAAVKAALNQLNVQKRGLADWERIAELETKKQAATNKRRKKDKDDIDEALDEELY